MLIITMNVAINNTMYSVHNLHTNYTKLHYKPFNFHQYLHQIFGLAYQSAFSYTYNLHHLNILQYRMIYHVFIHIY